MHGRRVIERRYSFDVSIDGNDREAGHLWMIGNVLTALILPTIELYTPDDDAHATRIRMPRVGTSCRSARAHDRQGCSSLNLR
jgi:hypothetical protein